MKKNKDGTVNASATTSEPKKNSPHIEPDKALLDIKADVLGVAALAKRIAATLPRKKRHEHCFILWVQTAWHGGQMGVSTVSMTQNILNLPFC